MCMHTSFFCVKCCIHQPRVVKSCMYICHDTQGTLFYTNPLLEDAAVVIDITITADYEVIVFLDESIHYSYIHVNNIHVPILTGSPNIILYAFLVSYITQLPFCINHKSHISLFFSITHIEQRTEHSVDSQQLACEHWYSVHPFSLCLYCLS